jgi:hypothetical protein
MWSKNEQANKYLDKKQKLANSLGTDPNATVSAGVVTCTDGTGFNLIVVNAHRAFLLFEENSYFELVR